MVALIQKILAWRFFRAGKNLLVSSPSSCGGSCVALPPAISEPVTRAVRYSLTRMDLFRSYLYVTNRIRVFHVFIVVAGLGMAWGICNDIPALATWSLYSITFRILCSIIFTVLLFCVTKIVSMAMLALIIMRSKNRGVIGEHELEIRDVGLIERTEFNESLHRWTGLHKIVMRRRYLYIYVTELQVHVVPRRCFASEQAARGFRDEIERRVNAAKSGAG